MGRHGISPATHGPAFLTSATFPLSVPLTELRRRGDTPVMLITVLDKDIDRLQGLRIGADDYIARRFNPVEVVARLHAILRRTGTRGARSVIRVGRLQVDTESYVAQISDRDAPTTVLALTEFRLLVHMARSPNHAFSRSELMDACLRGSDARERIVDCHIRNLRKKLARAGASEIVAVVRGVGYRLED